MLNSNNPSVNKTYQLQNSGYYHYCVITTYSKFLVVYVNWWQVRCFLYSMLTCTDLIFSQLLYVAIICTWTEKARAGIPNVSDVAFRMEHTMVTVRERARKLYGWSFGGRTPVTGCTVGGTYKTLDCDVDWIHLTIHQDAVLTAELVSVYNILLWCSCVHGCWPEIIMLFMIREVILNMAVALFLYTCVALNNSLN